MKKRFLVSSLFLLMLLCLLSGCGSLYEAARDVVESGAAYAGSAMYDSGDAYMEEEVVEEAAAYPEESFGVAQNAVGSADDTAMAAEAPEAASGSTSSMERKLIRTVDMDVETEEYDGLLATLEKKIKGLGGYIESSSSYNNSYSSSDTSYRSAYITARIPANRLDEFLGTVSEESNVTRKDENVNDVTLSYVDLESHRNALRAEEKRLLSFMEDAESIEDLITIEDRLTSIRYQLESMESQLRTYDNQVSYSTVHLNISEVRRYSPTPEETPGERISRGLMERFEAIGEGLKEFGIGFVIHLPDIILVAVIVVIILLVIKLIIYGRKKRRERKEHGRDTKEGGGTN